MNPLTKAQTKIMDILCDCGASNQDIAVCLGIAESTVKRQLARIMDKTGYSNRTELAVQTLHKMYERKTV